MTKGQKVILFPVVPNWNIWPLLGFLDLIKIFGRTPLDEWSVRRKGHKKSRKELIRLLSVEGLVTKAVSAQSYVWVYFFIR
jgi:hypothetical protein